MLNKSAVLFLLIFLILASNVSAAFDPMRIVALDYYYEGFRAIRQGNFLEARTAYQRALLVGICNKNYKKIALNNMGVIYALNGNIKMADRAFKDALAIDPDYAVAQINLKTMYRRVKTDLKELGKNTRIINMDGERVNPGNYFFQDYD